MSRENVPIYMVDAFTNQSFGGNPAAVCLVTKQLSDEKRQKVAMEMNLSETSFVEPVNSPNDKADQLGNPFKFQDQFKLRWFTPKVEVALCGHATLATAFILFGNCKNTNDVLKFETKSGILEVRKKIVSNSSPGDDDKNNFKLEMRLPTNFPEIEISLESDEKLRELISITLENSSFQIKEVHLNSVTKKLLVEINLSNKRYLESLQNPNFEKMISIDTNDKVRGIIITGQEITPTETKYDFVSRYFAPWVGINEDPVTGSAHTVLAPYWSNKIKENNNKKKNLFARQCSKRGGELWLKVKEDCVFVSGEARLVMEGIFWL